MPLWVIVTLCDFVLLAWRASHRYHDKYSLVFRICWNLVYIAHIWVLLHLLSSFSSFSFHFLFGLLYYRYWLVMEELLC